MNLLKRFFARDGVRLSVASLLVFLAAFCTFPPKEIWGTLPLLLLAGVVIPFFYDQARYLIPICVLSCVLLAVTLTEGEAALFFFSLVPSAFFAAGFYTARLLRFFAKGPQKRIPALCGVLSCVLLLGAWHIVFGNPITLTQVTEAQAARYEAQYSETFSVRHSFWDPLTRTYCATFCVRDLEFTASSEEDGYLNAMVQKSAVEQKSALLALLHENFSDGNYHVTVTPKTYEPFSETFAYDSPPEKWGAESEITLEFDSAVAVGTPDALSSFARRVREYVTLLNEEGFPYASITFRGGEYQKPVYELTATPDTPIDELVAPNVKDLTR